MKKTLKSKKQLAKANKDMAYGTYEGGCYGGSCYLGTCKTNPC